MELLLGLRAADGDDDKPPVDSIAPPETTRGLTSLAARLRSEEKRLYLRLRHRWSAQHTRAFTDRVAALLGSFTTIAALSRENVEIERKYLLTAVPPRARNMRAVLIEQGWIPGERLSERLRKTVTIPARHGGAAKRPHTRFHRTIKLGSGVRRMELEERTTRAVFNTMWPLTSGKRVSKIRYTVRERGYTWEIDKFVGRRLVLAEVELPDEAESPRLPRWLAPFVVREVTDDARYVNRNLAR
jgi:CYTH domain-containing protein